MARKSLQHRERRPRKLPEFKNPEESRMFMEAAKALGIHKEYFDEVKPLLAVVTKGEFRVLSDEEFSRLPTRDKSQYLQRASEALEQLKRLLLNRPDASES